MALSVLIVDQNPGRSAILEQALIDAGHKVVARLDSEHELADQVARLEPDVIIIDMEAPGRDALEQMRDLSRANPKPIVLFTHEKDPEYIRQAVQAGVSAYVVDGLQKERVLPIVEVAIARFREYQALRRELETARSQLNERKLIERAKGLLMQRRSLSEDQAYRLLRKTAMNRGLKLAEVAQRLLELEELL